MAFVPLSHHKFRRAQRDVFIKTVEPDCMNHQCSLVKHGNRTKLDACCQYGADTDIGERDGILAHAAQIRGILRPEAAEAPWFTDEEHVDADFPSGRHVRTQTWKDGCVFLAHDGRGCAIHRASIEGGWDFHGIKPHVCRLFPLSYETDAIVISDDYADYSCAFEAGSPSVYRVARPTVEAVFGADLVAALDEAEAAVLGSQLRVAR